MHAVRLIPCMLYHSQRQVGAMGCLDPLPYCVRCAVQKQVRAHNETRGKHGRFLLGHEAVDTCQGGVFVVDISAAQVGASARFSSAPRCPALLASGKAAQALHAACVPVAFLGSCYAP